ncbi:GTP-binding protein gtr2 [Penicillium cataractarum]|uniref:GTP-binding protein n=1 Tax=Penicillium cataractarum TaxID=2100454 RepID=A0A9W9UYA4_9EURO|nr:GTP-binding protein gtr2 [Penicillium cataractarum]KAJ5359650.1 GTP-binding protein gtr2 [Penicillium cataractarum]
MAFPHVRRTRSMDFNKKGRLSNPCLLHRSKSSKTVAQLSLENILQGTTNTAVSGHSRVILEPSVKPRDAKPRLLLMGLRRSFMDFQVWDFPGQLEYLEPSFDLEDIFGSLGALVWVIDAQDDYLDSVARLNRTILTVQQYYPGINVEVFIHKVDGLSEEYRHDAYQDIVQRITDELNDAGYENAPVHFYLTSIYDYSVFEAFSKVIQKLIPNLSTLENLITTLGNNCGFEKTYLFDVLSKIYIASDTRPVDMAAYEMCSDYIDVIVDISELYSWDHPLRKHKGEQMQEAESHVVLHDETMLHLMEMNKYLCLVSVIRNPEAREKKGLIDMNCRTFQEALNDVFSRSWEREEEHATE